MILMRSSWLNPSQNLKVIAKIDKTSLLNSSEQINKVDSFLPSEKNTVAIQNRNI
jgi:hypothetical protein